MDVIENGVLIQGSSVSGSAGDATAANQVTGNTSLDAINTQLTALGAASDAFATTDTGTNALIALVKRLISKQTKVARSITITTSTSAYIAGDVVDTTKTISTVNITGDTVAELQTVTVKENGGLVPDLSFVFLRAAPSGGTYTDNEPLVWGSGDMANVVSLVRVRTADWYTVAGKSIVTLSSLGQVIGSNSTSYSMLIITDAGYAPATTTNLTLELGFSRSS